MHRFATLWVPRGSQLLERSHGNFVRFSHKNITGSRNTLIPVGVGHWQEIDLCKN
ncbi:hypothetical protein GJAV_G00123300 [Gymnothorax javanicus]|nr:hypothetical protein GJAV_G00123300 [Gymnothorax javanicus]